MTKTRELTDFERGAIYGLWKGKRHTIREIAEALEIPKSTISDNITRYKNSSFTTKPRTGRPQILDERDKREIVKIVKKKRKLAVEEIKDEFNIAKPIEVSTRTVQRALHSKGYYGRVAKKKPLYLAVNLQFVNNKNLSPYDLKRESISFAAKYLKDEEDKKGESSHAINEEEEKKKETLIRIFDVSESDLKILNQAEFSVHRYYMDLKENLKHQSTQFKSDNVKKLFNTFTMLVINFNTLTDLHHDIKDLDNSLCVVVPLGEFEGGELVFPEINLVVELK
ncbi:5396_t:CDS:2 [Entrophospora sp. SA101]|nr:5396_t:CDS:2 [Entrophospora sp. SA101]